MAMRQGGVVEIEWDRIRKPKFDRIVEALFTRLYGDADEFRVYDGRGGDGGKDIYVRQGKRVRIFQLKYFPEGFRPPMSGDEIRLRNLSQPRWKKTLTNGLWSYRAI